MASINKEILIQARPELVWAAVRDVGAVHRSLVPGLVVDTRMEDGSRVVTFESGAVVRELIVDIDDDARRFSYAVVEGIFPFTHHNASIKVIPEGPGRSRLLWTTDLLPDELSGPVGDLMERGSAIMKRTLERG